MKQELSRRGLIQSAPRLGLAAGLVAAWPTAVAGAEPTSSTNAPTLWPGFPRQDAKLVAEVVGASHRNEARVRELVTEHPALVNAWWDWGFGDWESPLGAASHTGQRAIAEFLLEQGARIDIFAAAMLGMTDVVKAFVTAQPGVQRKLGPHGITLLAHAIVGGDQATDVVAYLESLGDAGTGLQFTQLPEDRKATYVGKFESGETGVQLETRINSNGQLVVETRAESTQAATQNLYFVGEDEFFPSGVPTVRFQFAVENGMATSVTIRAKDPILTARRVGG